jgi:hypothetical protein
MLRLTSFGALAPGTSTAPITTSAAKFPPRCWRWSRTEFEPALQTVSPPERPVETVENADLGARRTAMRADGSASDHNDARRLDTRLVAINNCGLY